MEERLSNTSLTHPFLSLAFLGQQHLGRDNSSARAAAEPSSGLGGVCVCACVGRGGRNEPAQEKRFKNRHTPQLPAPDTFRAAKSPPTLAIFNFIPLNVNTSIFIIFHT